jgi:hypothetical protein
MAAQFVRRPAAANANNADFVLVCGVDRVRRLARRRRRNSAPPGTSPRATGNNYPEPEARVAAIGLAQPTGRARQQSRPHPWTHTR